MAITTDLGDAKSIHPPKKKEVGDRLALLALKNDYGKKYGSEKFVNAILRNILRKKKDLLKKTNRSLCFCQGY